ncbi:RFA1 [Hepatospora eriocheir]|uniref:Replication protein A subunit n=1 Tax=Hepatospora eriocheir TaxID=1081669 RepID=A0A1X0QLI7_9MICR|nr:RFA1 [Hepatospora eriocheir]
MGLYSIITLGEFTVRQRDNNKYLLVSSILKTVKKNELIGKPTIVPATKPTINNENKPIEEVKNDEPVKKQKISDDVMKIKDLNPFLNNWTIKGRVNGKSDIKKFNSKNGEGKLFSFQITDNSTSCKVVAFNNEVEQFYPMIENEKVYKISKGSIKMANKQYNVTNFDYEIALDRNTEIELSGDADIPEFNFNFIKINEASLRINQCADIVGIISEVYPVTKVTSRFSGNEIDKRTIMLLDDTGQIRVTLWGQRSLDEYEKGSVMCLSYGKISEYNGLVDMSTVLSSRILVNSDLPEPVELLTWYKKEGKNLVQQQKTENFGPRGYLEDSKEAVNTYTTIYGSVIFMKEDNVFYYKSCPGENCNKKVYEENDGNYRCEKCNFVYDHCNYRYLMSMIISDFTDQVWATVFNDVGEKLFGLPVKEMINLSEEDPTEMIRLFKSKLFKDFIFKVKSKEENVNGEMIKKFTIVDLKPIDTVKDTEKIINSIKMVLNK